MSTTNEMQDGMLSFRKSDICIKLQDGTEHLITEEHYVEILQQYNSECSTYIALNQQCFDGIWYFNIIDFNYKDEVQARFRLAKAGERKRDGTLRIEKNKLYIDLWNETTLQIEKGTNIELSLPDKNSVMRWQRVRIDYNETTKQWVYYDIFSCEHILQDQHKNSYGVLEYNQSARITY